MQESGPGPNGPGLLNVMETTFEELIHKFNSGIAVSMSYGQTAVLLQDFNQGEISKIDNLLMGEKIQNTPYHNPNVPQKSFVPGVRWSHVLNFPYAFFRNGIVVE